MAKRTPAVSAKMPRPAAPLTRADMLEAVAPVLELLGGLDPEDVSSLTIRPASITVNVVPRRGRVRQLDSVIRVTYPVAMGYDDDTQTGV